MVAVWVVAVLIIFLVVTHYRENSESLVRDRADARNTLTADFASKWTQSEIRLQRRIAELEFSGPSPTAVDLRRAGGVLDSDATVLTDSEGRVLGSLPDVESLIDRRVAYRYSHLQAALKGDDSVSDVVLSVVQREPVVAIAVPFETPYGRRVLNAGFDVNGPALKGLVDDKIQLEDAEFALLDSSGAPVATTVADASEAIDPNVVKKALGPDRQSASGATDGTFYSLAAVPGTPWTMALTVPESVLYASLPPAWLQWVLIAGFAGILLLVALLFEGVLESRRRMKVMANLDSMTRLPNRGFTTKLLCRELTEQPRIEPLCVLLIDVDHFKQINDQYGHSTGDEVLATLASRMQNALRPDDVIGRWGGEEFLAILRQTHLSTAKLVAERLRETIESDPIVFKNMTLSLSISIGCVQAGEETLDQIVDRADLAMYRAKSAGRNVVVAA